MIIGIGCDIVGINRISRLLLQNEEAFLKKILTTQEICLLDKKKLFSQVAKRFAAKEAFSKALGTGIGACVSFHDIEIISDLKGKPNFTYSKKLVEYMYKEYGNFIAHLSISDEKDYAQAFVIIEKL